MLKALLVASSLLLLMTGCAQLPLSPPTANFDFIQKAKASGTAPVAVGTFQLAAGVSRDIDQGLSVRSNSVTSPFEGSMAQYLKQSVTTDLQASGLYDASAPTQLTGLLTESTLSVPIGDSSATLGARFVLTRAGQKIYEKELKANASWKAEFLGALAIPDGINRYVGLYHQLVDMLLNDPEYQKSNPK